MAHKIGITAPKGDLQGQLALMLCEALLHVLVEKRAITKRAALEAIDTVAELTRERTERGTGRKGLRRGRDGQEALAIIEAMRRSFAAKS